MLEVISEVVDLAQEEATIEDELTVIRKRWEDRKFVLTREQVGPPPTSQTTTIHKLTVINQVNINVIDFFIPMLQR